MSVYPQGEGIFLRPAGGVALAIGFVLVNDFW
jgi:hypothetical protein